jgi:hypothetical protein
MFGLTLSESCNFPPPTRNGRRSVGNGSNDNLVISPLQKSNQESDGLLSQFLDHIGHISLHEAIPLSLVYVHNLF